MGPHFEGIEMQHERRQREPQIIQFFGPGVICVIHAGFACGSRRALSTDGARWHPVVDATPARRSMGSDWHRRVDAGNRRRAFGGLLNHGQLQHAHMLSLTEQRYQHTASIRKFDRVMVPIRCPRICHREFSHAEIDFSRPNPSVVVSDVFGECQFSPGQHAHRDFGLLF
jgi:hypothetical protein